MKHSEFEVGDAIGPYRVIGKQCEGVYRAEHEQTARRVQIVVAPETTPGLAHPGVARILDRGVLRDGRPWISFEEPEGTCLYDLVAGRKLPAMEVVTLLRQVADVLVFAHRRRVVHRALTLRSIYVASSPRAYPVCITDWAVPASTRGIYTAPEGMTGDGRADIYSLGVIAFRALTGAWPKQPIEDLPGVPDALALLVARMLASAPYERPTSIEVSALARELVSSELSQPYAEIAYDRPRITRPRWTPAPLMAITYEQVDMIWGEIKSRE